MTKTQQKIAQACADARKPYADLIAELTAALHAIATCGDVDEVGNSTVFAMRARARAALKKAGCTSQ